ncbi:hypothetical protein BTO06_16765 [Tenacibaculum sp. SZ-18]|uniref:hypothetical protein n=1 Tax=Tenacibaculum sp. SZ-18 TaxID=754423 RepID=UPI000C2CFB43|nr:hypothetical protein [Tenacibaculum sp. SZ-18]AUC16697.1 hypothetical protein BTO06_16765 [Tenacibaculum sp. SZ-18]
MKKIILNLGKVLDRTTQRNLHGGGASLRCQSNSDCCNYKHNSSYGYLCYNGTCAPGIFGDVNPCGL